MGQFITTVGNVTITTPTSVSMPDYNLAESILIPLQNPYNPATLSVTQVTGTSTKDLMSQKATTDAINGVQNNLTNAINALPAFPPETEPAFNASIAFNLTSSDLTNFRTAYGWGNHAGLYRPIGYVPAWSEISSKPVFATVATTGSYNDLINKPTLFNGTWTSLTGKPTALSAFTNDLLFISSYTETDPTVPSYVKSISSTNITNWNTAVTNSHLHANKTVLDGIDATAVSNWNGKQPAGAYLIASDITGKENISNKENTTLDTSITKYPTNNLIKTYVDNKTTSLIPTNSKIIPTDFIWTGVLTGSNQTWIITFNHVISGNVTIPANVTLYFMGGSITGITTLTGNNTKIIADDANIISATTIAGTWTTDHTWFRWFGAKGDAATDDYVKGQQLLDWAYSNNRMKVWMGTGRYRVATSGFTIKVDFEGQGNHTYGNSSEIYNRTTSGYGVKVAENYITLQNFTVYGNATANFGVGATCGDGILVDGTIYTGIQYVTFKNVIAIRNSYGFRFTAGAWLINFYDCYAVENLYDGFNADSGDGGVVNTGQKNHINWFGCTSTGNGRNGWTLWGMSLHLYGCDAELNYAQGVDLNNVLSKDRTFDVDCLNTMISGCHFEGNGYGAIHVSGGIYNTHYMYVRGLIIEGCYIYDGTALMKDSRVNSLLFESYGAVNEGTGAIRNVRVANNTFAGDMAVLCNFNGLLDAQSYIDLPTDTHFINFGRATNPNQYRTLVINGYFYAKGVTWTNPLRSETVPTGTTVSFPITLPSNCNIQQYKIWVQTDATNYTITFNTMARDGLTGIGAYGNSLIYTDAIAGNSGSKLINSSTTGSYTASNRVIESKNDMYLNITVTITTPGTYLYLGNPVILYKP